LILYKGSELKRLDYKLKDFMPKLYGFINEKKKEKNIIWIGDLNVAHKEIDIANPKSNKNSPGFTIEER
jgi:exonuclease III